MLTNEETAKTQAQEDDGRGGVFSTAQNAVQTEKMVMETPYDDATFRNADENHQIDLGVRVSGKKVFNRDDDQMRKHREHFFTVRVDNLSFDATTSDF